ncbi:Aerotaxis receptor [Gimesia panareensis]|uniref:Aerotaxis receptor n=1 Tax=Gimesia panareensis TaxID=2527978 RepID=A0A517Q0Z6_9PLAN|nr:PAS domain-containing protein [Gimesia panareensis]QDT25303.1 Aerotaxis receptor [Gimesia panareensis]
MERPNPTGLERTFADHEIIVSKTDLKGRITYANHTFIQISGFTEEELLGQPHNLIRHPDMPRSVFKLLWDTIQSGEEIFAYVVNLCKNGDHYWVLAHVTPTFNLSGEIIGYHSSRRVPERKAIEKVIPRYRSLKRIEGASSDWRTGMQNAILELRSQLDTVGMEYDEYVFAL